MFKVKTTVTWELEAATCIDEMVQVRALTLSSARRWNVRTNSSLLLKLEEVGKRDSDIESLRETHSLILKGVTRPRLPHCFQADNQDWRRRQS